MYVTLKYERMITLLSLWLFRQRTVNHNSCFCKHSFHICLYFVICNFDCYGFFINVYKAAGIRQSIWVGCPENNGFKIRATNKTVCRNNKNLFRPNFYKLYYSLCLCVLSIYGQIFWNITTKCKKNRIFTFLYLLFVL